MTAGTAAAPTRTGWPALWVYPVAQFIAGAVAGVTFLARNADDT
jgi:glycerol uptake facilitator-like aquaporin